jgi:hypothetical protein
MSVWQIEKIWIKKKITHATADTLVLTWHIKKKIKNNFFFG